MAEIARAGLVAIVQANVRHSVKAITDGRAIIIDYPAGAISHKQSPKISSGWIRPIAF
ncbi:MAG: hypothetical protein ACR2IV_18775 [Bryobacteraceae bacterium]